MFEDIEQQLRNSVNTVLPPSAEFQAQLKTRLLEQREQIRNRPAFSWISWKIFVPAGAMLAVLVFMVIPQFKTQDVETIGVEKMQEPKPLFIPKPAIPKPAKTQPAVQTAATQPEQPVQDFVLPPIIMEAAGGRGLTETGGSGAEDEAPEFAEAESAPSSAMMAPQNTTGQPSLSLRREYYDIDGNEDITSGSSFIISIFPSVSQDWAGEGTFEVSDILPEGLIFDPDRFPSPSVRIEGRRIIFTIPFSYFGELRQGKEKPLMYYVRAQTPGIYTLEPAQIRSAKNPDWRGFSARLQIKVK